MLPNCKHCDIDRQTDLLACWLPRTSFEAIQVAAHVVVLLKKFVVSKVSKYFGQWGYREPKKKALLVGIQHNDDPDAVTLTRPHRDVQALKQLLIGNDGVHHASN